jgi:hypothetical protein
MHQRRLLLLTPPPVGDLWLQAEPDRPVAGIKKGQIGKQKWIHFHTSVLHLFISESNKNRSQPATLIVSQCPTGGRKSLQPELLHEKEVEEEEENELQLVMSD